MKDCKTLSSVTQKPCRVQLKMQMRKLITALTLTQFSGLPTCLHQHCLDRTLPHQAWHQSAPSSLHRSPRARQRFRDDASRSHLHRLPWHLSQKWPLGSPNRSAGAARLAAQIRCWSTQIRYLLTCIPTCKRVQVNLFVLRVGAVCKRRIPVSMLRCQCSSRSPRATEEHFKLQHISSIVSGRHGFGAGS